MDLYALALNIGLGVVCACLPLIYGLKVKQFPNAISGAVTAVLVSVFTSWLISLATAGFFCVLIYNADKKYKEALAYKRKKEYEKEHAEKDDNSNRTIGDNVWSADLIESLNQNDDNKNV